jgi:hypothetical protein
VQPKPPYKPSQSSGVTVFLWLGTVVGLVNLGFAIKAFLNGRLKDGVLGLIAAAMFICIPRVIRNQLKKSQRQVEAVAAIRGRDPEPWLRRDDWAKGEIVGLENRNPAIYLIGGAVAFVFVSFIALDLLSTLRSAFGGGIMGFVFPGLFLIVPVVMLVLGIRGGLRKKKFGRSVFRMSAVPGLIGGTLAGKIEVCARLKPITGVKLQLQCLNIEGAGSEGSRTRTLWKDNHTVAFSAIGGEAGVSTIPVLFQIPNECAESDDSNPSSEIRWWLEARAALPGVNYLSRFEVPVFRVADAAASTKDSDPTAPLPAPMEEFRRDEHSKIQVADGPGGREFYFPAARNIGAAVLSSVFTLAFCGGTWATVHYGAPILFSIILVIFSAIGIYAVIKLWFKASRVTIDSTGVTLANRWLSFSQTRRFSAGEIVRFDTQTGMTSGKTTFQDIKLVTRDGNDSFDAVMERFQQTGPTSPSNVHVFGPGGVTLAIGIASTAEARWLAQEMTRALGRNTPNSK